LENRRSPVSEVNFAGYYDKGKFDAMTETERNAMFDTCFDYDDHLRANGTRAHCAQVLRADPVKRPSIPALTNRLSVRAELGTFAEAERNVLGAARQRQIA
jgi:hypothetical protein